MASLRRRSGNALASSLNLASQLLLHQQEAQRARREKSQELHQKFLYEIAESRAKSGLSYTDPSTGSSVGATAPQVPQGLTPYSYNRTTGTTYRAPHAADPSRISKALIDLQDKIGTINEMNAAEQMKARPASKGFFGLGGHPAYTPQLTDASALQALQQELLGNMEAPTAIPQATQPTVSAEQRAIYNTAREQGKNPDEARQLAGF